MDDGGIWITLKAEDEPEFDNEKSKMCDENCEILRVVNTVKFVSMGGVREVDNLSLSQVKVMSQKYTKTSDL